jgi:hypothetical protein
MMARTEHPEEYGFVKPNAVNLSPAALKYAEQFGTAVGARRDGPWVVSIDWVTSVELRDSPTATPQEVGPCLTLGAYKRHQVPVGFTRTIDGFEFAIKIPSSVLAGSKQHLIDVDPALPFKLTLR